MKTCKQCKRFLTEDKFRQYKSRSKSIYSVKHKVSCNTICKECEAINMRAHTILKKKDAGAPYDKAAEAQLIAYYTRMAETGREPITAAARRLMGLDGLDNKNDAQSLIDSTLRVDELSVHYDKVKFRAYTTFDEADEVHRRLTPRLREAGLYEDVNNMMDDWYMDL